MRNKALRYFYKGYSLRGNPPPFRPVLFNNSTLETIFKRQVTVSPLAVPKIVCSLFTSHNFDRYANSHSLYRPQGAVVLLAHLLFAEAKKRDRLRVTFTNSSTAHFRAPTLCVLRFALINRLAP